MEATWRGEVELGMICEGRGEAGNWEVERGSVVGKVKFSNKRVFVWGVER